MVCGQTAEQWIRERGQREGAGTWGPWNPVLGRLDSVLRAMEHCHQTYVGSNVMGCAVGKPRPCGFRGGRELSLQVEKDGWKTEQVAVCGRTTPLFLAWVWGGGPPQ